MEWNSGPSVGSEAPLNEFNPGDLSVVCCIRFLGAALLGAMAMLQVAQAAPLQAVAADIEAKLGGHVGIAVLDTATQEVLAVNGEQRFPLMSTFKTLACAKLLSDVANGYGTQEASVLLKPEALISWSPVTEKYVGRPLTLGQACAAAMTMSDNTAANVVLEAIGGPQALTAYVRSLGDQATRLDRREPDLNSAVVGDLRDTTTPQAMVRTLSELLIGIALPEPERTQLTRWMMDNKVADPLLRSVLPPGWRIADRSGAGANGSRGITAVVWPPQHAPLIIAIYLTGTRASMDEMNRAVADIGREVFKAYE